VAGSSIDCEGNELHGFLWQPGGPLIDLNAFVPPGFDLIVTDGETINDRGEIAGSGLLPDGDFHAILLVSCGEDSAATEGCQDAAAAAQTASASVARNRSRLTPETLSALRNQLFRRSRGLNGWMTKKPR
jgi:hypothetical protein